MFSHLSAERAVSGREMLALEDNRQQAAKHGRILHPKVTQRGLG